MADELESKINNAKEDLKKAWVKATEAVDKMTQNSSTDVAKAAKEAAAAVAAADAKLKALEEAQRQQMGAYGGRRKHKARGTKRHRRGGGFPDFGNILPESLKNLFGFSSNLPPGAAAPSGAAPTTGASGSFGGKSGKKRKHSRRKY